MDSAALDKVLDEIGYVSREELEEERKLREEERKLLEEKLNAREEERKLLEEELKALEEGRKKSVAGLYGMGVAPEAISAALGMTFSEVVANLLECLAAQPKDSGQGS
jgi:predicted Holliday junction resolvase-like endonuclease